MANFNKGREIDLIKYIPDVLADVDEYKAIMTLETKKKRNNGRSWKNSLTRNTSWKLTSLAYPCLRKCTVLNHSTLKPCRNEEIEFMFFTTTNRRSRGVGSLPHLNKCVAVLSMFV